MAALDVKDKPTTRKQCQSKGWFLTYPKCPADKETLLEYLKTKGTIVKAIVCAEQHEDGTPHLHAFVKYETKKGGYGDFWDFEAGDASYHGNYQPAKSYTAVCKYVRKTPDYIEFGDMDALQEEDASKGHKRVLGKRLLTEPLTTVIQDHPELIFGYTQIRQDIAQYKNDQAMASYQWKPPAGYPNAFQLGILDTISKDGFRGDGRTCHWYCDGQGGWGKSTLATDLMVNHGAYVVENCKTADIAYLYNGQPIVIFDFVRDQEERINYHAIESIIQGRILSTKYLPQNKLYAPPHVIVFANFAPDQSKLSKDRWNIQYRPSEPFVFHTRSIPPPN